MAAATWTSAAFALAGLAACSTTEPASREATPFDWTLGTWQGVRRDGGDGSAVEMTMRVEPILGGHGQLRHLEVRVADGVYRGFAVQTLDRQRGIWVRYYVNDSRGSFARLETDDPGEKSVWRSATPGRRRASRLLSERVPPHGWRRTMRVADVEAGPWRILWTDELVRIADSP